MPINKLDPDVEAIGAHAETLLDLWLEIRPLFAKRCPPATVELLRHAYYLGATGAFSILVHGGADDTSAEDGVARIDRMNQELRAFQFDIRDVRP